MSIKTMKLLGAEYALLLVGLALGALFFSPTAHAGRKDIDGIQTATFKAVDQLADTLSRRTALEQPLLVASAQDLNDLGRSEAVGRLIGELVASAFSGEGYLVQEIRLRESLRVSSEGEHLLSRNVSHLASETMAEVVVVSTYAVAGSRAYITVKAVQLDSGLVLASRSFVAEIPRGLK